MKKSIILFSIVSLFIFFGQFAYSAPLIYLDLDGNGATPEIDWSVNPGDSFTANIYAFDFVDN